MKIEEARFYLEHTSKDDFNLEEHQKENRYQAIQVVLEEIERLNRTTKYVESLSSSGRGCDIYDDIKQEILKELKGVDKE